MWVTPGSEGSSKLAEQKGKLASGKAVYLALAAGFAILSGIFLPVVKVVRAAQDDARASITPIPKRPGEVTKRSPSIRVDVNLVLIPVMVTDRYERPVEGLKKSNFHLFENGAEREISQFFSEEMPISVGIVFDASASMRRKMDPSIQAVRDLIEMSLPGDEFSLLKFSDRPESVCDFTTEIKDIEQSLPSIRAGGWTSLFDAIYLGVHQMKHASHDRKVIIVLSDGGDNNSRYTQREIEGMVKESDVRIFSISILDRSPVLETIAEESGGRAFRVGKLEELTDLISKISAEIHSQYVLGFSPLDRTNDGLYRKIRVELVRPAGTEPLRTSWKHGYYAPTQ